MEATRRRNSLPVVEVLVDGRVEAIAVADLSAALLQACAPVRSFRWHHGQRHFPGWYWSATNGGHVMYESRLELVRLMMADFDPCVVTIRSQPFRLTYRNDEDVVRRQTPDFALLHDDGGICVVNVKPAERLQQPEIRQALVQAHAVLERHGFATEIWSGHSPQFIANLRFLAMFRDERLFLPQDLVQARQVLGGPMTVSQAEQALEAANLTNARAIVLHLAWRQWLRLDLEQGLDGRTLVVAA